MKNVSEPQHTGFKPGALLSLYKGKSENSIRLLIVMSLLLLFTVARMEAEAFRMFIPIDSLNELRLNYPRDSFTLSMIPPGDVGPDVSYSWKLDDHDADWSVSTADPIISYEGLSPGCYRLHVRMYDGDRMTEKCLPLRVTPPFWKTVWFYVLIIVLLLCIVVVALLYYMKGLRRRTAFEKTLIFQMLEMSGRPVCIGMVGNYASDVGGVLFERAGGIVIDEVSYETDKRTVVDADSEDPVSKAADDEFLARAMECVRQNITNESFGKGDFASAMMISQSLLYKKIKAITDMSVVEFIRSIRLNHAMTLLRTGKYNVTEVSEMCGFSSSAYFSRVFKEGFGKSPSELIPKRSQPEPSDDPSVGQ